MRRILSFMIAVIFAAAIIFIPSPEGAHAADYSWVKVKLTTNNATALTMYAKGDYFVAENGVAFSGGTLTLRTNGSGGITVNHSALGDVYSGSTVSIKRANVDRTAGYMSLNSRYYLGHFNLKATSSGYIQVVNEVPLAHYLYGVVGYEMNDNFPMEALKAQAIAAKCYVFNQMGSSGDYYIGDTSADQVYKGYNSSYTNVINAVDSTLTEVLTVGSSILCSYFAASNGGETTLPTYAWPSKNRTNNGFGISLDDYDLQNTWSPKEVVQIPIGSVQSYGTTTIYAYLLLKAQAAAGDYNINYIDSIYGVSTGNPAASGVTRNLTTGAVSMRVMSVSAGGAVTADYDNLTVEFRLSELYTYGVVTNASLRIYWGEYNSTQTVYYIYHARWGHGVGLSQRGAQQRAAAGQNYRQILAFYYPGANITNITVTAPVNPQNNNALPTGSYVTATTTGNVNFRKSASSSSSRLGTIPTGTTVYVYSSSAGWAYAVYGNAAGYISEDYLKYDMGAAPTPTPGTVTAYGYVNASGVKFRKGPSTSYGYHSSLSKNTQVNIVQKSGDWYEVIISGVDGYVYAKYINVTGSATPVPEGGTAGVTPTPAPGIFATPTPTPDSNLPVVTAYGEVTASGVNFRSGPSTSYSSYGTLTRGTRVSIYNKTGDWYYGIVGTTVGYVSAGYVKLTGAPTATVTPAPNASPTPAPSATPSTVQTAIITGSGVNFRSGPSTGTTSLQKLSKNTGGYVMSVSGDWYYLLVGGQYGYVYKDYVKITGTSTIGGGATGGSTDGSTGKGVTTGGVNIRKGPSTEYATLGVVPKGTELTVYALVNGWYKVKTASGTEGYISGKYVNITQSYTSGSTAGEAESSTAIGTGVTTATVNFRESPSTSAKKITQFKKGVTVTLYSLKSGWYEAEYSGKRGYLYAAYVQQTTTVNPQVNPTATPTPTPAGTPTIPGVTAGATPTPGTITPAPTAGSAAPGSMTLAAGKITSKVNFRSAPNTTASIYKQLTSGTAVTVLGKCSDWYYILVDGAAGYVNSAYLSVTSSGTVGIPNVSASSSMLTATTNNAVEMHATPTRSGAVIATVPKSARVTILYEVSGWCLVQYNSLFGFIEFSLS